MKCSSGAHNWQHGDPASWAVVYRPGPDRLKLRMYAAVSGTVPAALSLYDDG